MGHRNDTLAALERAGFSTVGIDLPLERESALDAAARSPRGCREPGELAMRLMALEAVFSWAGAPEEAMSSERLRAYALRSKLEAEMSDDELDVWQLERDEAQDEHGESIGWLLESAWPLAWALGYARAPELAGGLIPNEVVEEIFYQFLPGLDGSVETLLARARPRSADELLAIEDLFACALHLARSPNAKSRVPRGFAPGEDGDLLAERLHALRFCLQSDQGWRDEEE